MAMMEAVRELFTRRKLDAGTAYRRLVELIAGGKPAPSNAVDIAVSAGKSIDQLEADCTRLAERLAAADDLKSADGMKPGLVRLGDAVQAAWQEREALEQRQKAEMAAATAKYNEAREAEGSARNRENMLRDRAVQVLRSTADPSIDQQIKDRQYWRDRHLQEMNDLGRKLMRLPEVPNGAAPEMADRINAQREQMISERQAEVQRLGQAANKCSEDADALELKKLDPMACALG